MVKGHNGKIEIQGENLVVSRTGMGAKLSRQSVRTRVIPLAALTGVDIVASNMIKNGRLRLGLGGEPLSALSGGDAANDPNTVLFTHQQRRDFEQLYEYLRGVVETNKTSQVDSAAAYAAAGDALLDARAAKGAKLAAKIGTAGEREDIVAAAARLGWTMGSKREIKKLPEYLAAGEVVQLLAAGQYDDAMGIVALTDRCVLFLRNGYTGSQIVDFPLDRISSVHTSESLGLGTLKIHVSGNESRITRVRSSDLPPLADAIRAAMHGPSPSTPPQPDALDQITKLSELHATGVLSDAEFESKKAELLARI
ncbi:PH domain-containing protein [Streptomyces sp. NBC_01016]|uniref:DUF4429 domain-containing protein n=1 Tax=Streptomyces sp. NBC_01016 TaxID=2903720 RepID=UPI00225242AB|nr:DUF4429 domain-containing protein [Streptomyces sp. NBC_01016]MCX4834364.1 PH domain-containing protein [Streptomyces sp. NBC_01016]